MKEACSPAKLKAAREGNEMALAAIIARFMPIIGKHASKARMPGLEYDDAVQEGLIGLFSALQNFGEDKGASFVTYAGVCIQNAIYNAQKAAGRKKHAPLNQSVPISEAQSIPGPEDAAIANAEIEQTLEKAKTLLSPMEKTVLKMYLDGLTYGQIAEKLGKKEKAIDNAMVRVRKKLK